MTASVTCHTHMTGQVAGLIKWFCLPVTGLYSSPMCLYICVCAAFNNSRRGSTTSYLSRSSSVSDNYDHYGNKAAPQSASRLSSVSDVPSWDHLDYLQSTALSKDVEKPQTELISRQKPLPSGYTYRNTPTPPSPVQPAIPIRRFSSQNTDTNLTIYTSPQTGVKTKSNSLPSSGRCMSPAIASTDSSPPNFRMPAPVGVASGDITRVDHMTSIHVTSSVGDTSNQPATPEIASAPGFSTSVNQHPVSLPLNNALTSSQTRPHPSLTTPNLPTGPLPTPMMSTLSSPHTPQPVNFPQHTTDQVKFPSNPTSLEPLTSSRSSMPPGSSWRQQGQNGNTDKPIAASCVQVGVQLEPDHSTIGSSSATEHYTQHQSSSNPRPAVQTVVGSNVWPSMYSNSGVSVSSNLHVSLSHSTELSNTSQLPPSGKSQIPNITVGMANGAKSKDTNASRLRRMGHVRHSSLGQNIPCQKQQQRPTHSRNRSLGSINPSHIQPMSTLNSAQGSCSNLSLMSNASICGSELSTGSNFLKSSQLTKIPDPDNGYDFTQHFNLFSQYTSNMALEYCVSGRGSEERAPVVPPVWCMGFWNRVVAVGCSNGQVEVSFSFVSS